MGRGFGWVTGLGEGVGKKAIAAYELGLNRWTNWFKLVQPFALIFGLKIE